MVQKPVFKNVDIAPKEVIAADSTQFSIFAEIGPGYTSEKSRLVYDFSATLGTSCPSRFINEDSGYVEVYMSNPDAKYNVRIWDIDFQRYVDRANRPSREASRMVVVDIDGKLEESDTIELRWGETYGGFGTGAKVTSVVPRPEYYCPVNIRYFADQKAGIPDQGRSFEGYERPEPDYEIELKYKVIPRQLNHARLIRKVDKALLIPHDLFWNIAEIDDLGELVEADVKPVKNDQGIFEYADKNIQVKPKLARFTETPPMDNVFEGMNLYWGDVHTHSKLSYDCLQRSRMNMSPLELAFFARDRAGLDFFSVTDHHCPGNNELFKHIQLSESDWKEIMEAVENVDKPGEFTMIPGIEMRCSRGDTVVLMNWKVDFREIYNPELSDIRKFWELWHGKDFFTIPHFHSCGSLTEGEWWSPDDLNLEPVMEIFSDHGSYEREDTEENGRAASKLFRKDRCGIYFLNNGYKMGFTAHSDDHKGHVGVNGVTAVFSESLDRDSIFDAYRNRRVYGTSNARIRLVFAANGKLMGSELPDTSDKELFISVAGENRLKKVDLFRNGDLYRRFIPDGKNFHTVIKAKDTGPDNWYVRVTQIDNHLAFSSPVWFE